MNQYSTTGCIVWPVMNTNVPAAHVTIVYLGEVSPVNNGLEKAVRALTEVDLDAPGAVEITGYEVFGRDELVDVATLDPTPLLPAFESIEAALIRNGLHNASSFPEYRPHFTLGLHAPDEPLRLTQSKILLLSPVIWWKDLVVKPI